MFGVLVIILCPDRVAVLDFSTGEVQGIAHSFFARFGSCSARGERHPISSASSGEGGTCSERGKKNERETRKLRCAKPSAPKSSRQRMKPILDWTKSKAEAYTPGAARSAPSRLHSVFAFSPGISETACCGRRSGSQPPFDACFGHQRSLLPTAFPNRIYVVSIQGDDVRFGS